MTLVTVPVASHKQKRHVAPHFDCHELKNARVPLMMQSALCGASTSGVT